MKPSLRRIRTQGIGSKLQTYLAADNSLTAMNVSH